MQEQSDTQLLRDFAEHGHEAAFREIVSRHADVVYASALRQVGSPDLAHDIAQSVFTDLARKARSLVGTLTGDAALLGWLYRSTRFAALNQLRDDRRRHARERLAMQQLDLASEAAPEWGRVQPVLDEAMAELSDEDREALLLRFFKARDFRAIGAALGISDDAAQKRVSRALERLRTGLTNRGVTTTAGSLSALLVAETISFAPAGLAATLSTAALAGTTLAVTATATVTKAIAMTTLQKTLIAAAFVAAIALGIYKMRRSSASGSTTSSESVSSSPAAPSTPTIRPASSNPPVRATVFARIYSPDTKQFAANLRAIKCPEETVKDIILAEINRKHRTQEEALRPKPADHVPFMWSANPSERVLLERRQQTAALARAKAAALREALGYDVPATMPVFAMRSSDQRLEEQLGNMAPEQRSAIRKAQDDYWAKVQALQDRTKGFWQPDDVAELEQLKRNYRDIVEPLLQSQSAAQATAVTDEQSKRSGSTPNNQPAAPSTSAPAAVTTFDFDWAAVETSDYKQYAANLRTLGFPEELLRTIITADVDKLYAAREESLKPKPVAYDAPLSERQKPLSEANWDRIRQLREVLIEKQAILKEVLGIYVPRELVPPPNARNLEAFEYGLRQLPVEKRDAVQIALENDWYAADFQRGLLQKTNNAAFLEAYKRIREERNAIMMKYLTPEEFERFEMNTVPASTELARRVIGMAPTDEEFLKMYQIARDNWVETGGVYGSWRAIRVPPEQIAAADERMSARLQEALGPERYLDYQLATSESGQQLRNLAARYDLSRDILAQAFQVQSEADRLARARQPTGELQDKLQTILGPIAWEAWTNGRALRVRLDP